MQSFEFVWSYAVTIWLSAWGVLLARHLLRRAQPLRPLTLLDGETRA